MGSISDATKIYWDVRPSARYETLEFQGRGRVPDGGRGGDGRRLARALARTCASEAARHVEIRPRPPGSPARREVRAARFGLDEDLIDTQEGRAVPARELIEKLLAHLRPRWRSTASGMKSTRSSATCWGAAPRGAEAAGSTRSGNLEGVVDSWCGDGKGDGGPRRRVAFS